MRRIDIFVSSPEDVQKERSLVERTIRAVAGEFSVPITVTYSNWLRKHNSSDKVSAQGANGSEEGRTWLCPCFWEYQDFELDQEYREQIPNTGSYDLVISILWSRLGTKLSPAFVMPDGGRPKTASEYEIAWVLDQQNRTPGFPELRVYRNQSAPPAPLQPKPQRQAFFEEWDGVQEFFSEWGNQKTFNEACSSYADLEEFESLFRNHFRDFLSRQLEKEIVPRKQTAKGLYWKSEPFRGLQFFDFPQAPIFQGRTKAVGEVLDALAKQAKAKTPFVLILGASGSGKSSLVRAGVLPFLTEVGTIAGEGPWRYAITRPGSGGDPFDSLAAALLVKSALPEMQTPKAGEYWRKLAAELKDDPEKVALQIKALTDQLSTLELDHLLSGKDDQMTVPGRIESSELVRHRKLRRGKPKAKIALFIDQLEDLFTGSFPLKLQRQYLAAVVALVRCQRVYVIAALGSDYYANYQEFPELVSLTQPSGQFDLQPPARAELRKMILSPAEASGLRFERHAKTGQRLDDALADVSFDSADQLPLLEHLLLMLYRKQKVRGDGLLRWSDFMELGGLEGALAFHAEEVFTKLDSSARQAFDFVLRRLAPVELDKKASAPMVSYRDLVSSPELESRLRDGAKNLVDSMVKEGLLTSETDVRQQTVISVAHPALFRKWPRVREWLTEDQEFLRMRDRVEGCLKLWLKQNRLSHDLLSPGHSLADGETLLNHFRSSLSNAQVEYIQKSLHQRKRGQRFKYLFWLPVLIVVASLAAVLGIRWFHNESLRVRSQEFGKLERKIAELASTDRGGRQMQLKEAEEKALLALHDAELSAAERNSVESQLQKAQELAKQNADLALAQRTTYEVELKQTQNRVQEAQEKAELASSQRTALEAELKQAQDKVQLAQQNVDLASGQRAALEAQLKQAQDKFQQAQQNADLVSKQDVALGAQLKQAQDQLQQTQQNAELASSQRTTLEAQLKQAQDKVQQAQQNADLASSQRTALETELKQIRDKFQQAQQNADLASKQGAALGAQLKQAQDQLQQSKQTAELTASQRTALETQLKQTQDKFQQAQQNADLASKQGVALGAQLKQAQDQLQQSQQTAEQASVQRLALEAQLKQTQAQLQQAVQKVDLASDQRAALQTELKQAQDKLDQAQRPTDPTIDQRGALVTELGEVRDKLQQAQQNADLTASQRTALETQLKETQGKLQQAQQSAELASNQRAELEAQLKQAQGKLGQAQQNSDLASKQSAAFEAQLKQAQAKLEQAQQNVDLSATQRTSYETRLQQAQEKLQQAQQNADLATSQRASFETQLKQAEEKLQQTQQNADLALNQRTEFEAQLKKAQDDLKRVQRNADLAAAQRASFETQLRQAQDKLQQAQQNADLATGQRSSFEVQLKQAQDKLQQVQQNAELSSSQRSGLETRLKKAEDNLRLAQQTADLATSQRAKLEAQLKDAEEKAQLAQKIADLVAAQGRPDENGGAKGEPARKNGDSASQLRSGRALPLDSGRKPDIGTSTQPLTQPVQPANH